MISQQRYMPWVTNSARRALTFRAPFTTSGYANLPHDITINGTTVSPTFRYEGGSATAALWTATVGTDLPTAGTGTDPTIDEFAPGLTDSQVNFKAGKHYQAASADYAKPGTDDIVLEIIWKHTNEVTLLASKYVGSADRIELVTLGTSVLQFNFNGTAINTPAFKVDAYNHTIVFLDRSGSGVAYTNGGAGTAVDISALSAVDFGTAAKWTLGARSTNSLETNSSISLFSLWQSPSWLDTHLQADVAKERFNLCQGIQPTTAKGTAAPSVATRSTSAYIDKLDSLNQSILVPVGAEWMRVCERKEDGLSTSLRGYLAETQGQNHFLYSEDFSQATAWDVTRSAISCANTEVNPDGSVGACALVGDAEPNTHFVGQAIESVIGPHQFSVFLKAGNKNFAYLDVSSVANCWAYIDLVNHEITSNGIGCTAHVCQIMDGWARYSICYTGGAADHSHDIYAADSDGDKTYTGDASTANIYIFGAQHEHTAVCHPTSYIKTTTAAVTRTKDQLRYVAGANIGGEDVGKGTVECKCLLPNYNTTENSAIVRVSDGGLSADSIYAYVNTDDTFGVVTTSSGGNTGISVAPGDISVGEIASLKVKYAHNFVEAYKNSVPDATPDTEADIPDDLDRIDVGQNNVAGEQLNGLISDLKIYKKPV